MRAGDFSCPVMVSLSPADQGRIFQKWTPIVRVHPTALVLNETVPLEATRQRPWVPHLRRWSQHEEAMASWWDSIAGQVRGNG